MLHVLRMQTEEGAPTVLIGRGEGGFSAPDVGREVPAAFTPASERLDAALEARPTVWTMSVQCMDGAPQPLLAYGRLVTLRGSDRPPIAFAHAIQLRQTDHVYPAVKGLLRHLSGAGAAELVSRVRAVATGETDPGAFCCWAAGRFESGTNLASGATKVFKLHAEDRIDAVVHDCLDARATAWLAVAGSINGESGRWEIVETSEPAPGGRGKLLVTQLLPTQGGVRTRASDMLSRSAASILQQQHKKSAARPTPAAEAPISTPAAGTPQPSDPAAATPSRAAPTPAAKRRSDAPVTRRARRRGR